MRKEESQLLPPEALQELQAGFAKSIRTPISFKTGKFTFQIAAYNPATVAKIVARAPQRGAERLAIYNEQYWYRLFTILQEEFPLLANHLGFWEFNQIACRYLTSYPSESPLLESLSSKFEEWFRENSNPKSHQIEQIIRLESLFHQAFHAPGIKSPEAGIFLESMPGLGEGSRLIFQAGFSLFEEDWNIMAERIRIRQAQAQPNGPGQINERESANSNPFTFTIKLIRQKGYWAIYQRDGYPEWLELNATAFRLLVNLQKGSPIGEACAEVAETLEEGDLEELVSNLPNWFTKWTTLQWFFPTT
jgi:hypothetical protein